MASSMNKVIPGQYLAPIFRKEDDKHIKKYICGRGTTISTINTQTDGNMASMPVIVASAMGTVQFKESDEQKIVNEEGVETRTEVVNVLPLSNVYTEFEGTAASSSMTLPQVNDIVLVRITRINPRQANAEIVVVEKHGNVASDSGLGSNGELAHKSLAVGAGSQSLQSITAVASQQSTLVTASAPEVGETFKGIIRSQDVRSTEKDKVKIIESFRPGDIVRALVISLGDGSNYYLSTARDDLGVIFAKSEDGSGAPMYALDWQHMICDKTQVVEKRKCAKPFV